MRNKEVILFNNLNGCKKICRKKNNCKLTLETLDSSGNMIIFNLNKIKNILTAGDNIDLSQSPIELNEFGVVKVLLGDKTELFIFYNNGSQIKLYPTDYITNYDCLKLINNIVGESSWFGNIYKNNKLKKRNTFIYSPP